MSKLKDCDNIICCEGSFETPDQVCMLLSLCKKFYFYYSVFLFFDVYYIETNNSAIIIGEKEFENKFLISLVFLLLSVVVAVAFRILCSYRSLVC